MLLILTISLRSMAKSYYEKLKDPKWQKKRLEILSRDNFECQLCDNEENETLHVHHIVYRKVSNPWDYENRELITLCNLCHETEHEYIDVLKDNIVDIFWNTKCSLDVAQMMHYVGLITKIKGTQETVSLLSDFYSILDQDNETTNDGSFIGTFEEVFNENA